jgi:hypothetical protein
MQTKESWYEPVDPDRVHRLPSFQEKRDFICGWRFYLKKQPSPPEIRRFGPEVSDSISLSQFIA